MPETNTSDHARLLQKYRLLKLLDYKNCDKSLRHFVESAFKVLEPGEKFESNWHIDYLCEHLESVSRGTTKKLIINIPPGSMKTLCVTVCWPVWVWIRWPQSRWLFTSYSAELSTTHSLKRRRLIKSDWFQEYWGEKFSLMDDQDRKTIFENTKSGTFTATSTTGTVGGKHGDFIVMDDPQNPERDQSETDRKVANSHVEYMVTTRLRNPNDSRVVLIMQRLHHEDATATLLNVGKKLKKIGQANDDYAIVSLDSVALSESVFEFPISKKRKVRHQGDLLWPSRFGKAKLEILRERLGSYRYNSQYQQEPTPIGGGVINRSWWKYYIETPNFNQCAWFWDTAVKEGDMHDYSVGILAAKSEKGCVILDMVRDKMAYPELKMSVKSSFNGSPAQFVIVEDKTSGQQIVQEFKGSTDYPVMAYLPKGSKYERATLVSPIAESGKVFLPENAPWLHDFLNEWEQFPQGKNDDIVDATVMALTYFYLKDKVGSFKGIKKRDPKKLKTLSAKIRSHDKW